MHGQRLIAAVATKLAEVARRNGARRVLGARLRLPEGGHLEREGFLGGLALACRGGAAEGAAFELVYGALPDEHSVLIETVRLEQAARRRLRLAVFGAVQGVGFRPFVFRLAAELGLSGWARNEGSGLLVEAEGDEDVLRAFARRLSAEKPGPALIAAVEETWLEPAGEQGFAIRESAAGGAKTAWLLPDLGTCPDCAAETLARDGRRAGYPFTNCARCGPRASLVTGLPYDRPNTTMAAFTPCAACAAEYADPGDRRFHAQPIACPACGPRLWLEEGGARRDEGALEAAARLIEGGRIVAVKGVGGFHLVCDARSSGAVRLLRARKKRGDKPFALLFPDLAAARRACAVSPLEEEWLLSQAAPIVLLLRRAGAPVGRFPTDFGGGTSAPYGAVAAEVAPGQPRLGVLLPSNPLQHLLMRRLGFPVVATSGNVSEEPLAASNEEARARLGGLADAFLMNDRPIARRGDDSIVRLSRGRQSVLRRARGLAPLPLRTARPLRPVLALGAHLKSTVSIAWERQLVTSVHLGDLETAAAWEAFQAAARDLMALYDFKPEAVACDLHPDYRSTQFAETLGLPVVRVQHHHAHVAACMAEQGVEGPVLGVAWDGLGLGTDGTLWGGEFLRVDEAGFARLAHLRPFPLPGGAAAAREPRRAALGLLTAAGLDASRLSARFGAGFELLAAAARSPRLSPATTSAGRLFDAVAALAGLCDVNAFEGQAAMALEGAREGFACDEAYPFPLEGEDADWRPLLEAVLADADRGSPARLIAARFHNALAELVAAAARRFGLSRVVLSGGVFQNAYLTERAAALLEADGFAVFTHQRLPANDGGISAGQAYVAGLKPAPEARAATA